MFTNDRRQEERAGRSGIPRLQYLQELVTQFQNTTDDEETREKIVANLANFSYDPYNFAFLRQLNVLELFVDCITEPNEKLVEFGIGGICNCCADPANAAVISQCGGIPHVMQCLSSPVRNTLGLSEYKEELTKALLGEGFLASQLFRVNYAVGSLYYLCNASNQEEVVKPEVVDIMKKYAAADAVNVSFSNLAKAFLEKYAP